MSQTYPSKTLDINVEPPYQVHVGYGLLNNKDMFSSLVHGTERTVVITDSHVKNLYAPTLLEHLQSTNPLFLTFPAGEEHKNRRTKEHLEDALFKAGCNRDTCVFAIGGGVVSDLAGFTASTYGRGIPMIYIPTTLLAMVDAGVGGKTGVNTPYGKNLIGSFHQPRQVIMDAATLSTLPLAAINDGLAEMLKHAFIDGATLIAEFHRQYAKYNTQSLTPDTPHWLLADTLWLINALAQSVTTKKKHVEADEFDTGKRHALNFGHTIGHALEQASNYTLSHGHAVAIGMLVESYICMQEGCLNSQDFAIVETTLKLCNVSLVTPWLRNIEQALDCMTLDKKSTTTGIRFVMLEGLGKTIGNITKTVSEQNIKAAIQWYNDTYCKQGVLAC